MRSPQASLIPKREKEVQSRSMYDSISRRSFMRSGAALPLAWPCAPSGEPGKDSLWRDEGEGLLVKLSGDGQSLAPPELLRFLSEVASREGIEPDYYSNGGVVDTLERKMAVLLGKERAVFLPTGTLANHLAVRIQARDRPRVIVQRESHLYNDSGDCAQILSNLNLIPLAPSAGTFTLEEVHSAIRRGEGGRVTARVGVISIESPVRRLLGELFDYQEMKRICAFARSEGIATHLDGARLFMASGYTGISPAEYASHFDTVYVSMWKYFNAPSGAILAGPASLLDDLFHARRLFGGGLPYAWPFAAAALHTVDGFPKRFAAGVEAGERLKPALEAIPGLQVEEIPNRSNLFKLRVEAREPEKLREVLREKGILLPAPNPNFDGFALAVNETLAYRSVEEIAGAFREAMGL